MLISCGYPGPPKPPSLNLPQPPTDLHAVRKGNNVYLSWAVPTETTDSLTIRHFGPTHICRSTNPGMRDCSDPVGEVSAAPMAAKALPAKLQQTFTDTLTPALLANAPSGLLFYAVSVLNNRGRSAGVSNEVGVPAAASSPPPADFHGEVTAAGVVLSWILVPPVTESSSTRRLYRVYRREEGSNLDTIAGEAPLGSSQLTDRTFDWQKTYFYRATVVSFVHLPERPEQQFESDDTPPVKIFAHDIFPPAVPGGLQAAFSGVGQQPFVDLIWTPDTEADLAGYNVYRQEGTGEPAKINPEPIKTPSFRDTNVASGHTYNYSVSALDVRGNESARSKPATESVP
jgi:hypothetical protein